MEKIPFTKMHALGNDYIFINFFKLEDKLKPYILKEISRLAVKMSKRNFSIGADGVILVLPSEKADLRMRIFNADGSEAEMCGNGLRQFALLAWQEGLCRKTPIKVETKAGIKTAHLEIANGTVKKIKVNLGTPSLERSKIPMEGGDPNDKVLGEKISVGKNRVEITAVNMGNPHAVIFVDDVETAPVKTLGPEIEHHKLFPHRTNVEFVEVVNRKHLKVRVWERGSGETLACGTGAGASLVASVLNGFSSHKATVSLKGGNIEVEWDEETKNVFLMGDAKRVYDGIFYDD